MTDLDDETISCPLCDLSDLDVVCPLCGDTGTVKRSEVRRDSWPEMSDVPLSDWEGQL